MTSQQDTASSQYFAHIKRYGIQAGWNLSLPGSMAIAFIERWGQVQGTTGKEDSAGRAYVELASPEDVVTRAFTMADLAVAELERRGWVKAVAEIDGDL